MTQYTPVVKEAHAFREISRDFTTPAEIFRESIANSLDAYARRIWLRVSVEDRRARETVLIDLCDDGIGLNENTIKAFLNLSDSVKPDLPPRGSAARRMTGYKGHGTKIYYNSEQVEVLSYDGLSSPVFCRLIDPRGELADNKVPSADIEPLSLEALKQQREAWGFTDLGLSRGTSIRVTGYHQNAKSGLEHDRLRDFITWFTRWGSWEPKLCSAAQVKSAEVDDLTTCDLFLRGLGKEPNRDEYDQIPFGHVFPAADCTDLKELRQKDDVDPLKYYVRTWAFADVPLLRNPDKRVDFLFALEGEGARRAYNKMLRRQGRARVAGDYRSEERYGLWLGRNFVPVQRFNSWVSEMSEYTRMHAFVNSEDLDLTANRGSVENTSRELLADIEETITTIFDEQIEKTEDYLKFQDELLSFERHRHAKKEADDYRRRLKRLESKEVMTINGIEFYSPKSEADLIALVAGVSALVPSLVPFAIRDYDSHFGFDGLAARNKELDERFHETAQLALWSSPTDWATFEGPPMIRILEALD